MMSKNGRRMFAMAAGALTLVLAASCASWDQYGAIRGSGEVTQAFRNYEINPQYRYFLMGSGYQPKAILGIDREYVLETDIWQEAELVPQTLKTMVDLVNLHSPGKDYYWGSDVLDASGRKVGVFYSKWRRGVVKVSPDKKVMVSPDKSSEFQWPKTLIVEEPEN